MNDELSSRNFLGLCILAAAIVLGVFLVARQIVALQRTRAEAAAVLARGAPAPSPLVAAAGAGEERRKIAETQRGMEAEDKLGEYERVERRPGLLQVFSMGAPLNQKKVEGVEFVKSVVFRAQAGSRKILADITLFNETGVPVTPRFQLILFNQKARFICRDTLLYITEELAPGDKRVETLSLAAGPAGVAYYEFRKLD